MKKKINQFCEICIFLVKLYIEPWFKSTNSINAPLQDLKFIKDSFQYFNSKISDEVIHRMSNHLWYLTPELSAMTFFDKNVPDEEKRKMILNLRLKEPNVKLKNGRSLSDMSNFPNYNLSDFVSKKTLSFFTQFGLPSEFLNFDPSTWETSFAYEECLTFCSDLHVVNDAAERGVKFIKDYNKILTNDEEEMQFILQVVEKYKKKYPSYKKSDLMRK